jgi:peroxiredoxin
LATKPFALIGVNVVGHDSKKLKSVMDHEKLPWRSFADGRAISDQWNAATPAYYVIDPKGVIRYKWVGNPGEKAIDSALEDLIQEGEGKATKTPK